MARTFLEGPEATAMRTVRIAIVVPAGIPTDRIPDAEKMMTSSRMAVIPVVETKSIAPGIALQEIDRTVMTVPHVPVEAIQVARNPRLLPMERKARLKNVGMTS